MASKLIKGITIEIDGDTTKLGNALEKVEKKSSTLQGQLNQVNKLLKFDPTNTEMITQKQQILTDSIEETTKKLQTLKEAEKQAQEMFSNGEISKEQYRDLQIEISKTEEKLKSLKNQQDELNSSTYKTITDFGKNISDLGDKLENYGKKTAIFSGTAIAGIAKSLKNSIDFESAFAGVEKTVNGTKEQLDNLRQGIRDMAKEIPSSTTEISVVAEAAGQLGIKTEDILSFTRTMIDLGNATNLTSDAAASALSKFANITNMSASDYDKLGSTIVALGNNFATTEADIVSMATRLAATGELTGLSQSQILSLATAMSSVGIEAEAGGSAMSKLLKKIQLAVETNSDSLRSYAKVANMSASEFKKAFAEDATSALSAFLSGLNDTERNGKSAIAILDDMGLTEVRLSNTILSLSNASDLMTDAIKLGNEAWEENSALSNETNKRYATTESQIEITKNKFNDIAITIGNKLLPIVIDILDHIDDWIDKFDNLDDNTKNIITKLLTLTATISPMLIIGSKVTKTIGNVTTSIGTLISKLDSSKGSFDKLNESQNNINSTMGNSITKYAGLIGALVGLGIAINDAVEDYFYEKSGLKDLNEELQKNIDKVNESSEARKNLKETEEKAITEGLSNMDYYKSLRDELSQIVDENGKVKEGYENRAKFITENLSSAMGIEIDLIGDTIKNYDTLGDSFDKLMEKQKAMIVLDAYKESYTEAIKKRADAIKDAADAQEELNKQQAIVEGFDSELYTDDIIGFFWKLNGTIRDKYDEQKDLLKEAEDNYNKAKDIADGYYSDITQYEAAYEDFTAGHYQKVIDYNYSYLSSVEENNKKKAEELQNEIDSEKAVLEQMKEIRKNNNDATLQSDIEAKEKRIAELISQRDTITGIITDSIESNKNIIDQGQLDVLSKLTGKKIEFKEAGEGQVQMYIDGVASKSPIAIDDMNTFVSDIISKINSGELDAESAGKNLIEGFEKGVNNQKSQNNVFGSLKSFASKALEKLKKALDEHSPSKATEKMGQFLDDGIGIGVEKNQQDVLKKIKAFGKSTISAMQNELSDGSANFDAEFNGTRNLLMNTSWQTENNKIASDIKSLTSLLQQYMPEIINNIPKDVVLDGKIVGELIAPEINNQLGIISNKEKRGY